MTERSHLAAEAADAERQNLQAIHFRQLFVRIDALEKRIRALEHEATLIRDPVTSVVVGTHPSLAPS